MAARIPPNDVERVEALHSYDILDTPPEAGYDELTELVAQICGCPVAFIGFIDETRDWLKSKYGLPPDLTEAPRDMTVCLTTVSMNDLLVVPDLTQDPRFADLPMVTDEPHLRFYCGMPLINPEGYAVGSLCVIDFEPRELEIGQKEAVRRLSHQVVTQLELRRNLVKQREALGELEVVRRAVDEE